MDEVRGKPAPDVYLTAARRLGVAAASCLALEDSPHGIASAKAAGMSCVALPDPLLATDPRYREADLVLPSMTRLDEPSLRRLGVPLPG
jgi:pseudouridine 5'-phosphatase